MLLAVQKSLPLRQRLILLRLMRQPQMLPRLLLQLSLMMLLQLQQLPMRHYRPLRPKLQMLPMLQMLSLLMMWRKFDLLVRFEGLMRPVLLP
jgi:hypothetical protein